MNAAHHNHGHDTCERLLESAARLFAEHGYEAASVRDITTDAGCNVAAVNYHFGGKERLYLETFRHLLRDIRDRRIDRVRSDMAVAGDTATLETFVESFANAFLEPLVDGSRGRMLMAFFDREMQTRRVPHGVFYYEFLQPLMELFRQALERVGVVLQESTRTLCMMSLVGQLIHSVKVQHTLELDRDLGRPTPIEPPDIADHIAHIVRFSTAGIRACARELDAHAGC